MSNLSVEALSHGQRERLAFIEFRLYFLGELRRSDICEKFGIAPAGATRDISLYKKLAPENLRFDQKTKYYRPNEAFHPVFNHTPHRVLSTFMNGFGDGICAIPPHLICSTPASLNTPGIDILSKVTRTIKSASVIRIKYLSKSTGWSDREIVPFALVNNGNRWHTRAYDRNCSEFRDFVLSRITRAEIVLEQPSSQETVEYDDQWNRWLELRLLPHPSKVCAEAIALDYGIEDSGCLTVRVRAAVAGYFLHQWSVDCSRKHILRGSEYDLWLCNPLELYGVKSALIAPGFEVEEIKK